MERITVLTASRDEIAKHIPRLRRFAVGLTRDRTQADDLVQDTLVKAIANEHQFQDGTNLNAWLLKIMRNNYVSELRRRAVRPEVTVNDETTLVRAAPASQSDHLELKELERALGTLSSDQRMAILLISLEGLSYEEAAGVMDVPVGTIRSRVSRARQMLRRELEQLSPLAGDQSGDQPPTGSGNVLGV